MRYLLIILFLGLNESSIAQKLYKNVNPIDGHIWYETGWIKIEQNAKIIGVKHVNLHYVNRDNTYTVELIIKSAGRNTSEIHEDNKIAFDIDNGPVILSFSGFNTDIEHRGMKDIIKPIYSITKEQLLKLSSQTVKAVKIQFAKKVVIIELTKEQAEDLQNLSQVILTGKKIKVQR